jgi:hypothetical protein
MGFTPRKPGEAHPVMPAKAGIHDFIFEDRIE